MPPTAPPERPEGLGWGVGEGEVVGVVDAREVMDALVGVTEDVLDVVDVILSRSARSTA